MLNLAAYDPRSWSELIDVWEADAERAWFDYHGTTSMWEFITTLQGEKVMNIFDCFKRDYPSKLNDIIRLEYNPYYFTSFIRELYIGTDPGKGNTTQ